MRTMKPQSCQIYNTHGTGNESDETRNKPDFFFAKNAFDVAEGNKLSP